MSDNHAVLGVALIRAIKKAPTLAPELVRLTQELAGAGAAAALINALRELGIGLSEPKPKKARSEAQNAALAKARAARSMKK